MTVGFHQPGLGSPSATARDPNAGESAQPRRAVRDSIAGPWFGALDMGVGRRMILIAAVVVAAVAFVALVIWFTVQTTRTPAAPAALPERNDDDIAPAEPGSEGMRVVDAGEITSGPPSPP